MKRTLTLLAAVVLTCGLFTGCKSKAGKMVDRLLFRPTAFVTNNVPETVVPIKTNQLVIVTRTNEVGQVTTSTNREAIVINVTVPAHQEVVPSAYEANPAALGAINTIGGLVPGYGSLAAIAATALLGGIAQFRSGKYKDALVSVAQGVEHFTASNPQLAGALKSTLAAVQADHGTASTVQTILAKEVESQPKMYVAPPAGVASVLAPAT